MEWRNPCFEFVVCLVLGKHWLDTSILSFAMLAYFLISWKNMKKMFLRGMQDWLVPLGSIGMKNNTLQESLPRNPDQPIRGEFMTKPVRCGFEFELPGSKHLSFPTVILMDQAVHRRSHLAWLPMLLADRTPVAVRVVVWLQHGVCAGSWAELGVGENRPLGTSNLRLSWTGVQSKLCFFC
jgi:hypothetical protein